MVTFQITEGAGLLMGKRSVQTTKEAQLSIAARRAEEVKESPCICTSW